MSEIKLPVFPKAIRLSVFGVDGQQGNDAVVTSCRDLSSTPELKEAASHWSGATCVFIANAASKVVRFFAPSAELPFCVHGTLAVGAAVSGTDGAGEVHIEVRGKNYTVRCNGHNAAVVLKGPFDACTEPEPDAVLAALGFKNADLAPQSALAVASAGSPKWLVHVADWQRLKSAKPNLQDLAHISRLRGVNGAYVFATAGIPAGSDVVARAFNPAAGVNEDAATGVAAAALAWTWRERIPSDWLVIDQYIGSNRTGRIRVRIVGDCIEVGGEVRFVRYES
jgi:PhzF family phenazine biosynthesis protein